MPGAHKETSFLNFDFLKYMRRTSFMECKGERSARTTANPEIRNQC